MQREFRIVYMIPRNVDCDICTCYAHDAFDALWIVNDAIARDVEREAFAKGSRPVYIIDALTFDTWTVNDDATGLLPDKRGQLIINHRIPGA